jgi:transposase
VGCFASKAHISVLAFNIRNTLEQRMKTGRPAAPAPIELSDAEHIELLRRSRQRKGPAESRIRAEIILACAGGESGTSIAHRLGIGVRTVSRWRVRFSRLRLDGLNDEHRSGRPRSITDEQVHTVVNQALQSKPEDASHWSTRSMSQATGISPASVMRIR